MGAKLDGFREARLPCRLPPKIARLHPLIAQHRPLYPISNYTRRDVGTVFAVWEHTLYQVFENRAR